MISASEANSDKNASAQNKPIRAKTIQLQAARNRPCMATCSAVSGFCSPRLRESSALIPTPVPQATATMIICTG